MKWRTPVLTFYINFKYKCVTALYNNHWRNFLKLVCNSSLLSWNFLGVWSTNVSTSGCMGMWNWLEATHTLKNSVLKIKAVLIVLVRPPSGRPVNRSFLYSVTTKIINWPDLCYEIAFNWEFRIISTNFNPSLAF